MIRNILHHQPASVGSTRLWMRVLLLLASVLVVITVGAGHAAAAPSDAPAEQDTTSTDGSSGKRLPAGLPAEMKPLIAGTDEFKNGPWFTGTCAAQGGDMAGYLASVFPNEEKLRYWRKSAQEKSFWVSVRAMFGAKGYTTGDGAPIDEATLKNRAAIKKIIEEKGVIPPDDDYGIVFPNDRSEFYPSTTPVCAEDIKRWTSSAVTTWGFAWAEQPDSTSIEAMTGGDEKKLKRITSPCDTGEATGAWAYCDHAFFVNCDQADRGPDRQACLAWNVGVGKMFDETANWIDRNTSMTDRIEDSGGVKFINDVANAFADLWNAAVEIVKFINDPENIIGEWANSIKAWSMSLVQHVLPGLAEAGNFDFTAQYFAEWYAKAVGMGIALMVVLYLAATVRAARHGGAQELMFNTAGYLPLALVLMLFAPGVAFLLEAFFAALSKAIVGVIGTSVDDLVNNVSATLGALTNETLVGGVIMGIIGFGLLGLGAFALYLGLLMHQIGIPLSSCAMAIGFAFFVYPPWRKKALRIPFTVLSLMASVPILFFMLGVVASIMNSAAINASLGTGELQSLGQLMLMALGFIVIGLAPFAMLKWAPILPDAEDGDRMGDSGGGGGQILGAGMGGAIGASRGARGGGHEPVGGQGGAIAQHATDSAANHQGGHSSHGPGASHGGGAGGGGHGSSIEKGSKTLGKAAALTGPEGGAAGRLLAAAGSGVGKVASLSGQAAYAGASGGTRAAAMNAANRTHGVAADSAPTPDHS